MKTVKNHNFDKDTNNFDKDKFTEAMKGRTLFGPRFTNILDIAMTLCDILQRRDLKCDGALAVDYCRINSGNLIDTCNGNDQESVEACSIMGK